MGIYIENELQYTKRLILLHFYAMGGRQSSPEITCHEVLYAYNFTAFLPFLYQFAPRQFSVPKSASSQSRKTL
ncbi:MAG: hypothetical protein H7202_09005 [Pedobacter sp.]|nr:hypothetical protein [Pedobacter sp.]